MKMDDPRLRLTDAHLWHRARLAEANPGHAKTLGAHGVSCVPQELSYVSYSNIWLVPVCHSLLYGVVRDFCNSAMRPVTLSRGELWPDTAITTENRRWIRLQAGHILVPTDFGRGYICFDKYR